MPGSRFEQGWSMGDCFAARNHRFTVLATTANGSTAHQVLGGDYAGGPRKSGQWRFVFNLVRLLWTDRAPTQASHFRIRP